MAFKVRNVFSSFATWETVELISEYDCPTGYKEALSVGPGIGDWEHGGTSQCIHIQGTDGLLRQSFLQGSPTRCRNTGWSECLRGQTDYLGCLPQQLSPQYNVWFLVPSCRNPGWHHSEQHAGWSGDREGAWCDPEGDARSRDQPAGSGLWLLACHSIPVYSTGQDYPRAHWEHQVRSKMFGTDHRFKVSSCSSTDCCSCVCYPGRSTEETWLNTSLPTTKDPG